MFFYIVTEQLPVIYLLYSNFVFAVCSTSLALAIFFAVGIPLTVTTVTTLFKFTDKLGLTLLAI